MTVKYQIDRFLLKIVGTGTKRAMIWKLQSETKDPLFPFIFLTLRRPLRRKLRMRGFYAISKVKESSSFKSDLSDPPSDFYAHLLENIN